MQTLTNTWAGLPFILQVLLALIAFVVVAEVVVLIVIGGWRAFWRTRVGAWLWAMTHVKSDWNGIRVTNLPVDPMCASYGGHDLRKDKAPEQVLNPHALSTTGYCSRCFREWRLDPQGVRDGWMPTRRPKSGRGVDTYQVPRLGTLREESINTDAMDTADDQPFVDWTQVNRPSKAPSTENMQPGARGNPSAKWRDETDGGEI